MLHSGPWTIVGKNYNKLISLLILIIEYGSGHPLNYIHQEKMSKYATNMRLIIKEKIKK